MAREPMNQLNQVKKGTGNSSSITNKYVVSHKLSRTIHYRLVFFILFIFAMFTIILVTAFKIQVVNQSYYEEMLAKRTTITRSSTSLRGMIYDRNGEILVSNHQRLNLVYYPDKDIDKRQLVQTILSNFSVDDSFTSRDLKDTFLYFYPERVEVNQQKLEQCNLEDACIYQLKLDSISDEQISTLTLSQKKFFRIYTLILSATTTDGATLIENISTEEAAYLLEHSNEFPGCILEFDWEREYPVSTTYKSILGKVSSTTTGIPSESVYEYVAKGYSLRDKVGTSGLESVYEDLLKGQKTIQSVSVNEDFTEYTTIDTGSRGYDLTLSLDLELQSFVEDVTKNILIREAENERRLYMNQINVVVMNPNNGEVLAMVSMNETESGEYYNDSSLTYVQSYVPGSIVKGATLYMGLDQGVVRSGEVILDETIKLKNSSAKSSWKNLGNINDITALAMSSNVYMMKIALRLAGTNYKYNGSLYVKDGTFDLMRSYYSMFGLGVYTQADVYGEQLGYIGSDTLDGNILDYAIGQYDTYTTMQLAQYISTVANNGYRIKPRILLYATVSSTNEIVYNNDVEVLNTVENKDALERVQEGFRACVLNGLCNSLNDANTTVAAKTGTAEAYLQVEDEEGNYKTVASPNNSVVAYAPYDDPQIAVACMIPHAWNGTTSQANLCLEVTEEIVNAFYEKE